MEDNLKRLSFVLIRRQSLRLFDDGRRDKVKVKLCGQRRARIATALRLPAQHSESTRIISEIAIS
jgi:hypothetical protein